ncbi:MAG: insulinase family protein, partial [Verrucomicrobia bacterium]|nr:insulinase family protein [Verrucomicrobiota bacterium]
MKNLIYSLLTAALCLCVNSASAAEQGKPVTNYKEIQLPELNSMQIQKPERYVMENGMTVYLLEDHEVPLIDLSLRIYTGSRWVPAFKAGLADIVGEVMRTGGSKKFPGDELDDELDNSA